MRSDRHFSLCRPSRELLFVVVLALCVTSGCDVNRRLAQFEDVDDPRAVEMTAEGSFAPPVGVYAVCTYVENKILLHWNEYPQTGKTEFLGGKGKWYTECGSDPSNYWDLEFTGSFDGDDFTGGMKATGYYVFAGEKTEIDYNYTWKAICRGDSIEGTVVDLFGFTLKVQPAPKDWDEDF